MRKPPRSERSERSGSPPKTRSCDSGDCAFRGCDDERPARSPEPPAKGRGSRSTLSAPALRGPPTGRQSDGGAAPAPDRNDRRERGKRDSARAKAKSFCDSKSRRRSRRGKRAPAHPFCLCPSAKREGAAPKGARVRALARSRGSVCVQHTPREASTACPVPRRGRKTTNGRRADGRVSPSKSQAGQARRSQAPRVRA